MATASSHGPTPEPLMQTAGETFRRAFGAGGAELTHVAAPGRVNLIGEHTDYNDGFVLPAAIDRWVVYVGRLRDDRTVKLVAHDFDQETAFTLDRIDRDDEASWSNYVRGVVRLLVEAGRLTRGFEAVIHGDIPRGSGLSSSAAMEIGAARFVQALDPFAMDGPQIAALGQRAEREFVGVQCGIMDQFASAMGRAGHAVMLDCRSLHYRHVPLPDEDVRIVVCNSGVQRELVDSAYNDRRVQCEAAVAAISRHDPAVKALRDVDRDRLAQHAGELDDVVLRRARHVVSENARVLDAVERLTKGDIDAFGRSMYASHESLRDDYEVSCPELDALVEAARAVPGTIGARMTGAGFGGCTVNLVRAGAVEAFLRQVPEAYEVRTGRRAEVYVCEPTDGAGTVTGSR